MAITEQRQAMACPYCGQGGFRSDAELQSHIGRFHEPGQYVPPPGEAGEKTYTIIVEDKLVIGSDGQYYDYDEYILYAKEPGRAKPIPMHPATAQSIIAESRAVAQPEPTYDPIGETTIGGYVYLQYKDRDTGEIYTDPDPVRQVEAGGVGAGDKFVGVESRGGYDFPVYEKPDGTRYTAPDAYGRTAETAADTGAMSEWQQWQSQFLPWQARQEYGLEQQGLAQQQQNTLAQMAAQPASWMQHAATSGIPPVVQPWMLPLQRQDYPEFEEFRAGQPIPGWPEQFTATNAQAYGGWGGYGGEPYQPQGFEPFSYTPPPTPPLTPTIPPYTGMTGTPELYTYPQEGIQYPTYRYAMEPMPEEEFEPAVIGAGLQPRAPRQAAQPMPTPTRTPTEVHQAEEEVRKRQLQAEPTKLTGGAYIPGFQYGGWVTQPTTARLAEKEPELVTPLSSIKEGMGELKKSMTGSSNLGGSSWVDRLKALSATKTAGQEGLTPAPALAQTQGIGTPAPTMQSLPQTMTQPSTYQAMPAGTPPQAMGQYPLGGMPELTRPSRQYQARMGPTALQQYYAYKQARTGATPEETAWRLWSLSPPGGGYRGLTYVR